MSNIKCECPQEGVLNPTMASWYNSEAELPFVKHEPGKCACTNEIAQYQRGTKILWLCSCCHVSGDRKVTLPRG